MAIRLIVSIVFAHLAISTVGIALQQAQKPDKAVALHKTDAQAWHTSPSGDPCTCLKWGAIYDHIDCGAGKEVLANKPEHYVKHDEHEAHGGSLADEEYCSKVYRKLGDSNFCLQTTGAYLRNLASPWCYVSSECKELNGGGKLVNSSDYFDSPYLHNPDQSFLMWKKCSHEKDTRLYDMEPTALFDLAKKVDIESGTLAKMAYPVHEGQTWDEVKDFLTDDYIDRDKPFAPALTDYIEKGTTVIFNSKDNKVPFGLMSKGKVYEVWYSLEGKEQVDSYLSIFEAEHPSRMVELNQVFNHWNGI